MAFEKPSIEKRERGTNPSRIEREDIEESLKFLDRAYKYELGFKDRSVTPEIVETNIEHAKRVAENARWIARAEGLDVEKLELAGICHDCGKLKHDFPGGINTFNHHLDGALRTKAFLRDSLKKTEKLAASVARMILRHSYIPFIRTKRPDVPKPETAEDFALRDADVLDQIDIWGFRKIVEIRQNPQTEFYKEDEGKIENAIASALKSANEAREILVIPTAKKIGEDYQKRLEKLLAKLKETNVRNLEEFRKVFDEFAQKSIDFRNQ